MQSVTTTYADNSKAGNRKPTGQVLIDWDLNGTYDDESGNIKILEIDRRTNEPLGGIAVAQFDVTLDNTSGRYTPGYSSIAQYLKIKRKAAFKLGFAGENIYIGKGVSEVPRIDEKTKEAKIHFYDELENIADFKLSDGSKLYTDIRTDLYIWDILDAVYAGTFTDIVTFDSTETISGDDVNETTNMRGGDQASKLTSTSGAAVHLYRDFSPALNLSAYASTDYITLFVYCENVSVMQYLTLRFHKVVDDTYGDLELKTYLVNGWNQLRIPKSAVIGTDTTYPMANWFKIGTSSIQGSNVIPSGVFDWSSIVRVEFLFKNTSTNTAYIILDELRMVDEFTYPERNFDLGVQTIPVAAFSGNTALFEIKTAAESEGAHFYADENGVLRFENRQHFDDDIYKVSVHEFNFSRVIEYKHPQPDQGLINSVVVRIKPRKLVAEKTIWTYGTTEQIAAGDTIERWASFVDPVPVTSSGLVTPVATTDYTANDNEDGSGTNRTSSLSITINKFTTSAQLLITNTYGSPIWITSLKLRGTPAEEQPETLIKVKDTTSITAYGETPSGGYLIDNKYLSDPTFAETLAQQLIDWYKDPINRVNLKAPAIPHLQIGDMITVINDFAGVSYLMRILNLALQLSNAEGMTQTVSARSVVPFELLSFFVIGTSSIEGTDIISP